MQIMGKGMSLEEFRTALSSDATIENEKLKAELKEQKEKFEEEIEKLKNENEQYEQWCKQLGNRCFVQTGGAICMSCDVRCCKYAFTEEDRDAGVRYMLKNKLPRTAETYEKVMKFMCERRSKRR